MPQAALALQMQHAAYFQAQGRPVPDIVPAPHDKFDHTLRVVEIFPQARQAGYRQTAAQGLFGPRKLQTVDDSLCRHKGRMIVCRRGAVKEKFAKTSTPADT
jgi:hypothetical protein